jgi:hypothetical protein
LSMTDLSFLQHIVKASFRSKPNTFLQSPLD